jgi:OmpA-OmpF porin, OOP family
MVMGFLNSIKEKISEKTLANLSSYLGEKDADVSSGLNLSLNTFMSGLLSSSKTEADAQKIIKVLEDGGHTGEILNNLEGFTGNFEKTQLLVTIGNNIANHFLGNKSNQIIQKLSDIAEIKKTSASSLLSISAPIALGFLGKKVKENNLNAAGLFAYFQEINEGVINALPPVFTNIFQEKKEVTSSTVKASKKEVKVEKKVKSVKKESSIKMEQVLPWVLLILAGIISLYFYSQKNKDSKVDLSEITVVKEKKEDLVPEDFLPDGSTLGELPEKNVVDAANAENALKPLGNNDAQASSPANVVPEVSSLLSPPQKKVEAPKEVTKPAYKPQVEATVKEQPAKKSIPSGFSGLNGSAFRRNSAEVSALADIKNIMNKAKESNKTVTISPLKGGNARLAEDRAYAIREKMIELGLPQSQVKVGSSVSGSDENGVVYKLN